MWLEVAFERLLTFKEGGDPWPGLRENRDLLEAQP